MKTIWSNPSGILFLVSAAQDNHYDLFMLMILKAIELGMNTLEVVTEARYRNLMEELSLMQSDLFSVLETSYGRDSLGRHSY